MTSAWHDERVIVSLAISCTAINQSIIQMKATELLIHPSAQTLSPLYHQLFILMSRHVCNSVTCSNICVCGNVSLYFRSISVSRPQGSYITYRCHKDRTHQNKKTFSPMNVTACTHDVSSIHGCAGKHSARQAVGHTRQPPLKYISTRYIFLFWLCPRLALPRILSIVEGKRIVQLQHASHTSSLHTAHSSQ
jgi:hypothetical protein